MWTIYQLKKSIAVLEKRTEEAWKAIRIDDRRKNYTLSTPVAVTLADREHMAYVSAWCDYSDRLKAARKQLQSEKTKTTSKRRTIYESY